MRTQLADLDYTLKTVSQRLLREVLCKIMENLLICKGINETDACK